MSDPLSYSFWISSITGSLHVFAAIFCIVFGPLIFFRRKGDKRHKTMGKIWVCCMLIVDIGALLTYEINGRPNLFHLFALLNLVTLIPGYVYIRKYQKTRNKKDLVIHQECMAWTYFGLVAAGTWQIVISLARVDAINISYKYLYNGLGIITAFASLSLFFYFKRRQIIGVKQ